MLAYKHNNNRVSNESQLEGSTGIPAPGMHPPDIVIPYVLLPTPHFSLFHHMYFNPRPKGPQCNCGLWQMWCLPPYLGGCGHVYVQTLLYCGLTVDENYPLADKALATVCPDVIINRTIRCAGWMMGLCPSCRRDPGISQAYNNFMKPFFVPIGLDPIKKLQAEETAAATWKAHSLAFAAWVSRNRDEGVLE
ncbi:hypothetical protein K439DRAFT_1661288 [Ramaria rubella]|nr:hypothetical protein K439DRAFT_1661288 [Ramaria rubella]